MPNDWSDSANIRGPKDAYRGPSGRRICQSYSGVSLDKGHEQQQSASQAGKVPSPDISSNPPKTRAYFFRLSFKLKKVVFT